MFTRPPFHDPALLQPALTHRSDRNEHPDVTISGGDALRLTPFLRCRNGFTHPTKLDVI